MCVTMRSKKNDKKKTVKRENVRRGLLRAGWGVSKPLEKGRNWNLIEELEEDCEWAALYEEHSLALWAISV